MHPRIRLQHRHPPEPGTDPLGPRERTRFERLRSPAAHGRARRRPDHRPALPRPARLRGAGGSVPSTR